VPQNRHAEIVLVPDLAGLRSKISEGERGVVLAGLSDLKRAREEFPRFLAFKLLPREVSPERLLFTVRAALQDARLQHDLEAAENIAWSGIGVGNYDDPGIELLGSSILDLAAARDMASVEEALRETCARIVPVLELRVVAYPETASSRLLGLYQLAVPVQFQGALKAHIYVRFEQEPGQELLEKVGEALLNLSDAVALAVERNLMISKAEETKTVWEASFDAVEDPVAILNGDFRILRGNRAFGRLAGVPLVKLAGREPGVVAVDQLRALPADCSSEWGLEVGDRNYRAFLDPIQSPLGDGSVRASLS
jgi:PAS domain-containing protein